MPFPEINPVVGTLVKFVHLGGFAAVRAMSEVVTRSNLGSVAVVLGRDRGVPTSYSAVRDFDGLVAGAPDVTKINAMIALITGLNQLAAVYTDHMGITHNVFVTEVEIPTEAEGLGNPQRAETCVGGVDGINANMIVFAKITMVDTT